MDIRRAPGQAFLVVGAFENFIDQQEKRSFCPLLQSLEQFLQAAHFGVEVRVAIGQGVAGLDAGRDCKKRDAQTGGVDWCRRERVLHCCNAYNTPVTSHVSGVILLSQKCFLLVLSFHTCHDDTKKICISHPRNRLRGLRRKSSTEDVSPEESTPYHDPPNARSAKLRSIWICPRCSASC